MNRTAEEIYDSYIEVLGTLSKETVITMMKLYHTESPSLTVEQGEALKVLHDLSKAFEGEELTLYQIMKFQELAKILNGNYRPVPQTESEGGEEIERVVDEDEVHYLQRKLYRYMRELQSLKESNSKLVEALRAIYKKLGDNDNYNDGGYNDTYELIEIIRTAPVNTKNK